MDSVSGQKLTRPDARRLLKVEDRSEERGGAPSRPPKRPLGDLLDSPLQWAAGRARSRGPEGQGEGEWQLSHANLGGCEWRVAVAVALG